MPSSLGYTRLMSASENQKNLNKVDAFYFTLQRKIPDHPSIWWGEGGEWVRVLGKTKNVVIVKNERKKTDKETIAE